MTVVNALRDDETIERDDETIESIGLAEAVAMKDKAIQEAGTILEAGILPVIVMTAGTTREEVIIETTPGIGIRVAGSGRDVTHLEGVTLAVIVDRTVIQRPRTVLRKATMLHRRKMTFQKTSKGWR